MSTRESITSDLAAFLGVLPERAREQLREHADLDDLLEVVVDLGRPIEARFADGFELLTGPPATRADITGVVTRVGEFDRDNRAGIEATLHRISAIRNRLGEVVGLTCRVGRAVFGTIDIIRDVIETGANILMLGRPGVGKTTKLREVARVLADEFDRRVVVVDTNNEIGGDGDIPHPAIGRARRMQVPHDQEQHNVMIEAVENHMPEVIVIDEIGHEEEAFAARTIAERGVQLIATAHGNTLDNLMANPTLCDLIGGIQAVTLGDEEAKKRGTQKTVLERKAPPTFDIVIEIAEINRLAIHHDVAETVDRILLGEPVTAELREYDAAGQVVAVEREMAGAGPPHLRESDELDALELELRRAEGRGRVMRLLPVGVSRDHLERALRKQRFPGTVTESADEADVAIALQWTLDQGQAPEGVEQVVAVRSDTYTQVYDAVQRLSESRESGLEAFALREAREATQRVLDLGEPVELLPQSAYIRRLQHELVGKHDLTSKTVGEPPRQRVRVLPP
jgi:stage III sporulation protein SpoIIIAA